MKSEVEQLLDGLAPGEKREHVRSVPPSGAEGRFWMIAPRGEISPASLEWMNDAPWPSFDPRQKPFVTMEELEQPILQGHPEESEIGDLYHIQTHIYLLSSKIVECIQTLDPEAVDVRKAETHGIEPGREFFLALLKRRFDAIDASRTNLVLDNRKLLPNKEIYRKTVLFPNGFCLREDIPQNVHCFVEIYCGSLLFSGELISCIRDAGVTGVYARHPTTDETRVPENYL